MTDDFRVKSLSNAEVRKFAKKLREYFDVSDHNYVDIIKCSEHRSIWTVNGERALRVEVVPDDKMPDAHGLTTESDNTVTIRLRRSVRYGAYMGDGRDRNTFAHEFGHAALSHGAHVHGAALARRPAANITPKWIQPFESAEHQVKVFAPAFLINDSFAETLPNADEISIQSGISLTSADIYFEQLVERRDREQTAKRVRQIAEEVREALNPVPNKIKSYLREPCTACGRNLLFPIGVKFMCDGCGNVSDRFQDGDML